LCLNEWEGTLGDHEAAVKSSVLHQEGREFGNPVIDVALASGLAKLADVEEGHADEV
jgi:hypothetical protein